MYVGHEIEAGPIDMARFDVTAAARAANEHLKTISEPRRRQILINFRDHALAEALGDFWEYKSVARQVLAGMRDDGNSEVRRAVESAISKVGGLRE